MKTREKHFFVVAQRKSILLEKVAFPRLLQPPSLVRKEADTVLRLERLNVLADGRLREMEQFGGAAVVHRLAERQKSFQFLIHKNSFVKFFITKWNECILGYAFILSWKHIKINGQREKKGKRKLEETYCEKRKKMIPGAAIALVIAVAAKFLESLEESAGLHFIGASVIAMFIGMIVNAFYKPNSVTAPGIKFTSKKILKFAIILLGASLNIRTVLTVGRFSLTVMVFTLATCFGLGALIGKALGLNWKTSSLINAGTGICGGSAIAAIAPVIEATDMDIAYGLSATFLFDTVMIVVFPILGHWMGLSDAAFGLWAGTAVNDTSSVVATGYAFSEAAGDFATMVKLTRTLAIIPAVLAFAAINVHLKRKAQAAEGTAVKVSIKSIFPWFILGFLAMSALTSLGLIPAGTAAGLKNISKFLMVAALAAIGLNTDFKSLCRSGAKPMLHGFIISLLVVIVAIAVEFAIGIAPHGVL